MPEAGWALLGLYYIQGRRADARRLGHGAARHRARPARSRATAPGAGPPGCPDASVSDSLVRTLEPLVRAHPEDLHTAIAPGPGPGPQQPGRRGAGDPARPVGRHGGDPDAWDALLLGLDESRRLDELAEALAKLPPELAGDPRFDRHRAAIAQERQDWSTAADGYLRAWRADPSDLQVLYRLSRVLQARRAVARRPRRSTPRSATRWRRGIGSWRSTGRPTPTRRWASPPIPISITASPTCASGWAARRGPGLAPPRAPRPARRPDQPRGGRAARGGDRCKGHVPALTVSPVSDRPLLTGWPANGIAVPITLARK